MEWDVNGGEGDERRGMAVLDGWVGWRGGEFR